MSLKCIQVQMFSDTNLVWVTVQLIREALQLRHQRSKSDTTNLFINHKRAHRSLRLPCIAWLTANHNIVPKRAMGKLGERQATNIYFLLRLLQNLISLFFFKPVNPRPHPCCKTQNSLSCFLPSDFHTPALNICTLSCIIPFIST